MRVMYIYMYIIKKYLHVYIIIFIYDLYFIYKYNINHGSRGLMVRESDL